MSKRSQSAAHLDAIIERLCRGDERTLAEAMTRVQNEPAQSNALMTRIYKICQQPPYRQTRVFGITGPPGAGKSTLLKALLKHLGEVSVGLLLIDPSSPFTGGALLGDRLRMEAEISHKHFVRSLGTRGERGGLCRAARDLVRLLIVSGKQIIFVETVGVGQTEVEIMDLADLTVVVLTPDSGDAVQTMKAGLLEIADLFVVNKADLPGADRMVLDLHAMDSTQIVLKTVATKNEGIADLWKNMESFKINQNQITVRRERLAREIAQLAGSAFEMNVYEHLLQTNVNALDQILNERSDPYSLAEEYLKKENFVK